MMHAGPCPAPPGLWKRCKRPRAKGASGSSQGARCVQLAAALRTRAADPLKAVKRALSLCVQVAVHVAKAVAQKAYENGL